MRIQSTRVYTEVSNAIQNGYKVVSAQGSSRSSKTYNILIFLIAYVLQHPKTSLSVVRKTLPALKGSVFRDFKEIMQEKFKIWDNRSMNKSEMIYTLPNGSFVEFFSTDDEQKIRGRCFQWFKDTNLKANHNAFCIFLIYIVAVSNGSKILI